MLRLKFVGRLIYAKRCRLIHSLVLWAPPMHDDIAVCVVYIQSGECGVADVIALMGSPLIYAVLPQCLEGFPKFMRLLVCLLPSFICPNSIPILFIPSIIFILSKIVLVPYYHILCLIY